MRNPDAFCQSIGDPIQRGATMDRRTFLRLSACSGGMLLGQPLLLASCSQKRDRAQLQPGLVLLFATCSVSQSHLFPYNRQVDYTPNIARFAAGSSVFTNHQTEASLSGVAYASIVSGNQADKHGIFDHPRKLDKAVWTISEAFLQNGYDTHFWGGHKNADFSLGYGQGVKPENHVGEFLAKENSTFDDILKRVSSDRDYRAFVLTTGTLTHNPYSATYREKNHNPETLPAHFQSLGVTIDEFYRYRSLYFDDKWKFRLIYDFDATIRTWGLSQEELKKFIRVVEYLYKCAIHRLDTQFGKIIRKLAEHHVLDRSLIIFTSDHGEILYRDNAFFKFCHGSQLTPEVLAVPFIIRAPSLGVPSKRYSFVSRSIDVFSTIAGLCSLRMSEKEKPDGIDLSPIMVGHSPPLSLPAFSHTGLVPDAVTREPEYRDTLLYKLFPQRDPELMWVSVRIKNMLYKFAKFDADRDDFAPLAFDLSRDPTERNNLFDHDDEEHRAILQKLEQYKKTLVSACRSRYSSTASEIPEEQRREILKSLGYI
jgi:arylsulfatase A-like enzyme